MHRTPTVVYVAKKKRHKKNRNKGDMAWNALTRGSIVCTMSEKH